MFVILIDNLLSAFSFSCSKSFKSQHENNHINYLLDWERQRSNRSILERYSIRPRVESILCTVCNANERQKWGENQIWNITQHEDYEESPITNISHGADDEAQSLYSQTAQISCHHSCNSICSRRIHFGHFSWPQISLANNECRFDT